MDDDGKSLAVGLFGVKFPQPVTAVILDSRLLCGMWRMFGNCLAT